MAPNIQIAKLRVALYLRVSTDEQAKEGYGLIFQEEKLRAFVQSQDYLLNEECVYRDEGFSGSLPITERTGLQRLFEDADKRKFDVVLVYRLDRFFRKTRLLLDAIERLNIRKIGFRSITESFDTTNITGRFMTTLLGAVAEMERDTIKERTTNGKMASAKQGHWVTGSPPYGYRLDKEKKKLVVEPEQAKWVKKFFEWLVYEQCSLKEIARRANNLKIPTKLQMDNSPRKATGLWWARTLGRTLTNEIYTGEFYLRKYKKVQKGLKEYGQKQFMRDESEWIRQEVPMIVSRELFNEGIKQLRSNSNFSKRKKIRPYMFSSMLWCSTCRCKLHGNYSKPTSKTALGSRHYVGFILESSGPNTTRCNYCGTVAETRLMPIWYALKNILMNPEVVYEKLEKLIKTNGTEQLSSKIGEINKELQKLKNERERINTAYLDMETLTKEEYRERVKNNEKRMNELTSQRSSLASMVVSNIEKDQNVSVINKLYGDFKTKMEDTSYEIQASILRIFIDRIDLNLSANMADVQFKFSSNMFLKDNSGRTSAGHNYKQDNDQNTYPDSKIYGHKRNLCE